MMATMPALRAAERELARRPRLHMPVSYQVAAFAKAAAAVLKKSVAPKRNKTGLSLVVNNSGLRR
jgi:hypothetical protein